MVVSNSGKYFFIHILIVLLAAGYQAHGQKVHGIENDAHVTLNQWNNNFVYYSKPELLSTEYFSGSPFTETKQTISLQSFEYWDENDQWDEIGPVTSSNNNTADVGRLSCIEIDPANDSIILAGSPSGGLYYTLNKGNDWINAGLDRPMEEHGLNFFTPGISSILIIHENNKTYWIIATGDKDHVFSSSKGVLRSTDYGNTWRLLNGSQPENLPANGYYIRKLVKHPHNSNILFAATSRGIYKTSNALTENPNDIKWAKILDDSISNGEGYFDLEFHKTQSNVMIASKEYRESNTIIGNEIIWTTDGGNLWKPLPGLNYVLPVGTEFTFFLSLLELTQANEDILYVYIKGKESSNYYNDFWKYNFTDSSWVQLDTIPYTFGNGRNGFAVSPLDENLIYCATVDTYCSTDGGYSWQFDNDVLNIGGSLKRSPHIDVQELKFNKPGTELWAASDGGPFLKILKDTIWINKVNNIGLAKILQFDQSEIDPNYYIFGGWDVGSQLYHKNQDLWKQVGIGDGYGCAFDNEENGTFYTASYAYDHNNIYTYKNWEQKTCSKYGNFWQANIVVNPVNHNIVYLSLGVKIVRSYDQGESWEKLVTHSELDLQPDHYLLWDIHVAESNGNYLYLRAVNLKHGEHPRIFKSTNVNTVQSSIDWIDITPENMPAAWLSDIAVNDKNPDHIWASINSASGTKIMEYDGKTWSDITSNLQFFYSGVYSIVHLKGSSGGLFAGTLYGTFYREDATSDWILYKPGLPNVKPVDLKINYKSGKVVTGLDGRGIWETDLPEDYIIPETYSPSSPQVKLYPNPANDYVKVEMLIKNINGVDFNIYAIDGKLVLSSELQQMVQYKEISLGELKQGLYVIQVKYNGKILCREKLLVIH